VSVGKEPHLSGTFSILLSCVNIGTTVGMELWLFWCIILSARLLADSCQLIHSFSSMTVLLPGRVAVLVCIVLCSALAVYRLSQERLESVASSVKATPTINSRQNARKLAEVTTAVNYEEPKSLIKKLLSLIYNRYEFGGPHGNKFFMTSNNISPETWDILKFKLATKMLTPGSTFLMTFSGSSVTAGHDNYYAQSYPYIFKKRMSEIFKGVGIELVVHDIALGANNCSPYVLCYESMGGADPDFINWEQVCVFVCCFVSPYWQDFSLRFQEWRCAS